MPNSGNPIPKTLWDHLDDQPGFAHYADQLHRHMGLLEAQGPVSFKVAAPFLAKLLNGNLSDPSFVQTAKIIYAYERARPFGPVIWQLDEDAYEALSLTEPPWALVRDRLPRLPFPAMMVRLPVGHAIPTELNLPRTVNVQELIVLEEIPGKKWRLLGAEQDRSMANIAIQHGWFDITKGSAVGQMPKYAETGEDAMWQLLINLFLALEHHHLATTPVTPHIPKSPRKREKLLRRVSSRPYSVLSLSETTRRVRDDKQAASDATARIQTGRKVPRRHLVRGHWHSFWKNDPGDLPVFNTRPRLDRDDRPTGEYSYLIAKWIFPYWKGEGPVTRKMTRVRR